jgi:hypothetical protein
MGLNMFAVIVNTGAGIVTAWLNYALGAADWCV